MAIQMTIKQVKALSTEQLVALHDAEVMRIGGVHAGAPYYLDELARREQDKLNAEMLRFTRGMYKMTVAITIATIAALLISVVGLLVSLHAFS